jgi:hypothetical protein
MAGPNLRRNKTVAASQASYAVFQFQVPAASEPLKARSMSASGISELASRRWTLSLGCRLEAARGDRMSDGRSVPLALEDGLLAMGDAERSAPLPTEAPVVETSNEPVRTAELRAALEAPLA